MPQFNALIVTRRKDGSPATYNLVHEIKSRVAMFEYVIKRYTNQYEQIESIEILEEVND